MSNSIESTEQVTPWLIRHYPLVLGLVGLLPLVVYGQTISQFFWFGDDFDLVGQIDRMGLWPWIAKPWAESYSPLFKFVWGSSVFVFRGSYFAMLGLVWASHAITTVLFGYLLRLAGFGWMAVVTTIAIVGLAWPNIETLCWSVQLSPMLANMFFVAAVFLHLRCSGTGSWRAHGWVVLCIAASALCYSRGVLTGVVLCAMSLVPINGSRPTTLLRRGGVAVAYLLPAVAVTAVIMSVATGNQQAVLGGQTNNFVQMLQYGLWYFCLNPFYCLLDISSWSSLVTWVIGGGKVVLIVGTLWQSDKRMRWLFVLLVLFELGNAALLGLGRYHTGLRTSVSYRYQYCALLGTIPFIAFWLDALLRWIPTRLHIRSLAAAGIAAAFAVAMLHGWKPVLGPFVFNRGIQTRAVLLSAEPVPVTYQVPGIPGLPPNIARELIERYRLH